MIKSSSPRAAARVAEAAWTKLTYKTFRFGFLGFHGPGQTMWYDDVAVAPQWIGCAP